MQAEQARLKLVPEQLRELVPDPQARMMFVPEQLTALVPEQARVLVQEPQANVLVQVLQELLLCDYLLPWVLIKKICCFWIPKALFILVEPI